VWITARPSALLVSTQILSNFTVYHFFLDIEDIYLRLPLALFRVTLVNIREVQHYRS